MKDNNVWVQDLTNPEANQNFDLANQKQLILKKLVHYQMRILKLYLLEKIDEIELITLWTYFQQIDELIFELWYNH